VKIWLPKGKVKVNMLHLRDQVKILDLLKDGMPLKEAGQRDGKMNPGSGEQNGTLCVLSRRSFSPSVVSWNQPHSRGYQGSTVTYDYFRCFCSFINKYNFVHSTQKHTDDILTLRFLSRV
jgi:hypothetical protein